MAKKTSSEEGPIPQETIKNTVLEEIIKALRSRRNFKRKTLLKQLKGLTQSDSLTPSLSKNLINKIELERAQVKHYDE